MAAKGVIAAGHEATVQAAELILREGGNAFDAILGAHLAACTAEPVLASLGGGGFLLAKPNNAPGLVYDFFTHTPRRKRPVHELDFRPITVDFGSEKQEFHIGQGTIATPGAVKALFEIHRDLGSMPLKEIAQPAIQFAREGVTLNRLQAYIFQLVYPIYMASTEARRIYSRKDSGDEILRAGDKIFQHDLADALEVLVTEGEDLFYRGEIARSIVHECQGRGHLEMSDLQNYRVIRRQALALDYRDARVLTNPPPCAGGILIAFALKLLSRIDSATWIFGSAQYLLLLAKIMALTNKARIEGLDGIEKACLERGSLLDAEYLGRFWRLVSGRAHAQRGTTHMSILDAGGNVASMSVSNGEGCGDIVSETGIMLNNMLGEEDLNPRGFHQWKENQRMSSMMAPSLVIKPDGTVLTMGSGGSNRIRSALLQVLINLLDFAMDIEQAVHSPRIHLEGNKLSVEGGFKAAEVEKLVSRYPDHQVWDRLNLFFGGVHTVMEDQHGFRGAGDPRRGGVSRVVV
jgi:gamma-glutamyltranspeptidase/glutathione hydrolase